MMDPFEKAFLGPSVPLCRPFRRPYEGPKDPFWRSPLWRPLSKTPFEGLTMPFCGLSKNPTLKDFQGPLGPFRVSLSIYYLSIDREGGRRFPETPFFQTHRWPFWRSYSSPRFRPLEPFLTLRGLFKKARERTVGDPGETTLWMRYGEAPCHTLWCWPLKDTCSLKDLPGPWNTLSL